MTHYFKRQISTVINANKDKSLNVIKKKIYELVDEEYKNISENNLYRYKIAKRELSILKIIHYQRITFKDGVLPLKEVRYIKKIDDNILVRTDGKDYHFPYDDFDYLLEVFN